jgi:hypothetical protein
MPPGQAGHQGDIGVARGPEVLVVVAGPVVIDPVELVPVAAGLIGRIEPVFEPLWKLPEFQAMVAEIEADMAAQLARVREMERNGELEPFPELAAD